MSCSDRTHRLVPMQLTTAFLVLALACGGDTVMTGPEDGSGGGGDDGSGGGSTSTVVVTDVQPERYEVDTLQTQELVYVDRDFTVEGVPSGYSDWTYVRTANDDKNVTDDDAVAFTLQEAATVALAYDERATALPDWLGDWTATGDTLRTDDVDHPIFTRDFGAGEVVLGGNMSGGAEGASSMYVLFASGDGNGGGGGDGGGDDGGGDDGGGDDGGGDDGGGDDPDPATGALQVTTATGGEDPDPNGYSVSVQDGPSRSIDTDDSVVLDGVATGDRSISLDGVASNCTVGGDNPRTVPVAENDTASTSFDVTCEASSGDDGDPSDVQIPTLADWSYQGEVIPTGGQGDWDRHIFGAMNPVGVHKRGGTLHLYYVGARETRENDGGPAWRRLGYATSTDGLNWTKGAGSPVVDDALFDDAEEGVFGGGIFTEGGTLYAMLGVMEGASGAVDGSGDLYTSTDGASFSLDTRDVIDPDGEGFGNDERFAFAAYEHGGTKYVFYAAKGSDVNNWSVIVASGPSWDNMTRFTNLDGRGGGGPIGHGVSIGGMVIEKNSSTYLLPLHENTVGAPNRTHIYSFDPSDPHDPGAWTEEFDARDSDLFGEELETGNLPEGAREEAGFILYLDRDLETWFAFFDTGRDGTGIHALTAPMR